MGDEAGGVQAQLVIRVLPRTRADVRQAPLLDLRGLAGRDETLAPVQLLEGFEYAYQVHLVTGPLGAVKTDRPELFWPDDDTGLCGRLRTGEYTGTLPITFWRDGGLLGRTAVEIRSRKLDYLSHYRWMLRDVAEAFAEVVMERFAPTMQRFSLDHAQQPLTLYQRFVLIQSVLASPDFRSGIQQVLRKPQRAWLTETESRRPGQHVPASAAVTRQLTGPGARVPWLTAPPGSSVRSLPARLEVPRTAETLDTAENRFVKFVLSHWRELVAVVRDALKRQAGNAPVERGLREADAVLSELDRLLRTGWLADVGTLQQIPASSQVLQKRPGYREIYRAYFQAEAAALLTWADGPDIYSAGQRDVAKLFEFWVYIELAQVLGAIGGKGAPLADLFTVAADGLTVGLKRSADAPLPVVVERYGRRLVLELYFNRYFAAERDGGSWTRTMQPDCSVRIAAAEGNLAPFPAVWVHFDAKYRVDRIAELFGAQVEGPSEADGPKGAKRDDLLKMHAYRDAIRRTVGAYVVYPGTEAEQYREYHELLPGLGAFALRPAEYGGPDGADVLRRFLDDVISHVASQTSQRERGEYWNGRVFAAKQEVAAAIQAVPFLEQPPADTLVLLGYVRSAPWHLEWIRKQGRYNLRADDRSGAVGVRSRELAAELLVLYGDSLDDGPELWRITGEPEIWTRERMLKAGYQAPNSEAYFCLPIEPFAPGAWPKLATNQVEAVRLSARPGARRGVPVSTTWMDLMGQRDRIH